MEKIPLKKTRGIWDATSVLVRDLENGIDTSHGIFLYGLKTPILTEMMVDVSIALNGDEGTVPVYTQEEPGAVGIDGLDYLLKGRAFRVSEKFYTPTNHNRMMIVVEGRPSEQRERFIRYLRDRVDVFVEPQEQYCREPREGVFVTHFRKFKYQEAS